LNLDINTYNITISPTVVEFSFRVDTALVGVPFYYGFIVVIFHMHDNTICKNVDVSVIN